LFALGIGDYTLDEIQEIGRLHHAL